MIVHFKLVKEEKPKRFFFENFLLFSLTGLGGYGYDYTLNRLSRIAQRLNLSTTNLSFIGSTWSVEMLKKEEENRNVRSNV